MTQNTQTTTERIATLISARIGTLTNQHSIDAIARNLAAEIDRLTAERDEARVLADARVGDLMNANGIYIDALKAERDFERGASSALADQYSLLAAERNALTAQLADARADIQNTRNELAVILRERNDAHLALAEARAEVERYDSVISNAIAVLTIRARAVKVTP